MASAAALILAAYKSNVTTIFFLGFYNKSTFHLLLFTLLLQIYIVTICGNLLIITLVTYSKILHSPMYFFLTQLSVTDLMLTTDITPKMLNIILHEQASISLSGCITQYYFFALSGTSECFLLTVMSYDRYLAICSPLHYVSIMNQSLCIRLVLISWLLSCSVALILTLALSQLQFCGPNTIDGFFCDFNPLMELSCSDVSVVQLEATVLSIPVLVLPFLVIVISYMFIIVTISKISSFSGRRKSFFTCSSHLTVVSMYYGTLIIMYILPNEEHSQIITKTLSLLYTVLIPCLNPFIYSLRNKDINEAFRCSIHNHQIFFSKVQGKII
ncbi:PREDICTED: olfactory receptor 476-like [Nanorana parkeri]|uniref:olfactory receptor 476-like n=1 Tax=Nanorana parkeri TaxID=125878 RepID=UPI0008541A6F|nr:PREDICTED: olfactory receptor 476-like [Nanorana parkeri]